MAKIYVPAHTRADGTRVKAYYRKSKESNKIAISKIESLPKGATHIFEDAKNIEGTFKKSSKSWSEVIETYEKNAKKAKVKLVDIKDIQITQTNVQSNIIAKKIKTNDNKSIINAVKFKDGTMAIYDGHHRLLANWAKGRKKMKVNLVSI